MSTIFEEVAETAAFDDIVDRCFTNGNTGYLHSVLALSDISPKDAQWDVRKAASEALSEFLNATEFQKWSERIGKCANYLYFLPYFDIETGEFLIKLKNAKFCHCRHCFVCDWRKFLKLMAIFRKRLPAILSEHPKSRWVFMTLTVPNVPIKSLRDQLTLMNKAWARFTKRKEFKHVQGFIRRTEVTCEKKRKGYAHPHFHCLLMVPPSWFNGKHYVKQSRWAEIWGECMHLDVTPIVDIRSLKGTPDKAAVEVLKSFNYSIKPSTMIDNPEWILEYFKQVNYLKFIVCGGELKDALKNDIPESDESLVNISDDAASEIEDTGKRFCTGWVSHDKYREYKKGHKGFD